MFSAYVVVPDPPPAPASVVASPSAIRALPIWSSRFLPVIAETDLTCPTFSAIKTKTTGKKRTIAFESNVGVVNEGAAFYGPKISVQAKDAIGRTWQMSTIQVDFQLPQRFELEYSATDGTRQRPVMIHRALFGSIERFFGVLTEHYSGAFPPWLAPVQAIGIPVADTFSDYLGDVIKAMRKAGIRAELDASDDRMQKKVRNAQMQKIPFMVIAGEEDQQAGAVSFRYRNGEQKNGIPIADAIAEIKKVVAERTQV